LHKKDQELFQIRKMEAIGSLAGGIAHDFNNLLTGILGVSEELEESLTRDDPRREDLEEIINASKRAFSITRQLLAFGRRQVSKPEILDINTVIRDLDQLLRRLIGEDIQFDFDL